MMQFNLINKQKITISIVIFLSKGRGFFDAHKRPHICAMTALIGAAQSSSAKMFVIIHLTSLKCALFEQQISSI